MATEHIRWGTDLITFFEPAYWGLPADLEYDDWDAAVSRDPRPYFDRMLDEAARIGLDGVELAPEPGGWEGALAAYGDTAGVGRALADRGLALSTSYAPGWKLLGAALSAEDADAAAAAERYADEYMARHARFVRELGADTIVMGTVPRAAFSEVRGVEGDPEAFSRPVPDALMEGVAAQLNRLGAIVGAEGVRIALHTDAYSVCSRTEDVDRLLSLTDPETVWLCPDAGHITLDGGDAVEVLRRHVDRTPVMHWKDCRAHLPGHTLSGPTMVRHATMLTYFRLMGTGTIDWREWMGILRDARWSGWAIAEIDMSPDPMGEIADGLRYFADELAPIYS
jgi:inosose dehydratase